MLKQFNIQELKQRIQRVIDAWGPNGSQPSETQYKQEMAKIRKDIVDFHGEMVLLVNYSNVNYTGIYHQAKLSPFCSFFLLS